jgi:peptidoglycan/xylan/chitin deacetylase (PgdA/CDA1 family)
MKKQSIFSFAMVFVACFFLVTHAIAKSKPLIIFTFDDGHESVYTHAYPILKKYGFPATFFVITGLCGNVCEGYVSWEDVRNLSDNGWEIGGHSHTHPNLTKISREEALYEVENSFNVLSKRGFDPVSFASPYGAYNGNVLDIIKKYYKSHRTAWDDNNRRIQTGREGRNNIPFENLYVLSSRYVTSRDLPESIEKEIDTAIKKGSCFILLFHRIADNEIPDGTLRETDYPFDYFERIVKYVWEKKHTGVLDVGLIRDILKK